MDKIGRIIVSNDELRLIRKGRKRQLRQILRPQPTEVDGGWRWTPPATKRLDRTFTASAGHRLYLPEDMYRYKRGDIIYLSEQFVMIDDETIVYRSDGHDNNGLPWADYLPSCGFKDWKSATNMPRKFARDFIQVSNIWCEQISQISPKDLIAEGAFESMSHEKALEWFNERWDRTRQKKWMKSHNNPWAVGIEFKVMS